jgi:hypothetical protein
MIGTKYPKKKKLGALVMILVPGVCCCAYKNQISVFSEFFVWSVGIKVILLLLAD